MSHPRWAKAVEATLARVVGRWSARIDAVHDDLRALETGFTADLELFRDEITGELHELFADPFGPEITPCAMRRQL